MKLYEYLDLYYPNQTSKDQTYQNNNCAEGMLISMKEYYDLEISDDAILQMKAFGGGLQKGDACGLLIGSYAGLTHLYQTRETKDNLSLKELLQLWYDRFEEVLGGVNCKDIRDELYRCKDNAKQSSDQLINFIEEMFV